jgi:hypothetical protein
VVNTAKQVVLLQHLEGNCVHILHSFSKLERKSDKRVMLVWSLVDHCILISHIFFSGLNSENAVIWFACCHFAYQDSSSFDWRMG